MDHLLIWLVVAINVLAFVAMGVDKLLSRREGRRIPEFHLLLLAFLLGWPAVFLASSMFRHKTIKSTFRKKLFIATFLSLGWIALYLQL